MESKYFIGIDFGTLSARAVLISAENGNICAEKTYRYPHGVITETLPAGTVLPPDYALADAGDYRKALVECIKGVVAEAGIRPENISAIGIDATTYTMVPCLEDGTALCELPDFANNPMAYIKLWKHHSATSQADKIAAVHLKTGGFPAIENYGGAVNCEWALPKLLETYEEAPEIFSAAYRICDLGEWLVWLLIGKPINSLYTAGFKAMYTPEYGWPERQALEMLSPGFADAFYNKVAGPVHDFLSPAGFLSAEAAAILGLQKGLPVATPMGDGSMPGIFFCLNNPGTVAITLGTSVAMAFINDTLISVSGINGVVKDGIVPGYYSYDAGQPCAGDMLDWFVTNQVPAGYFEKAAKGKMNIHEYLSFLSINKKSYLNPLTVLDWFNGNRGILNNLSLRGTILGVSLDTRAEDIYCAMVQSIACGMRVILEHFSEHGIYFKKIVICGGIAEKNDFILKEYANILGRKLYVSRRKNITATGAAVLAAIATGTAETEATKLCCTDYSVVEPDNSHKAEYETIYQRYLTYYKLLGSISG